MRCESICFRVDFCAKQTLFSSTLKNSNSCFRFNSPIYIQNIPLQNTSTVRQKNQTKLLTTNDSAVVKGTSGLSKHCSQEGPISQMICSVCAMFTRLFLPQKTIKHKEAKQEDKFKVINGAQSWKDHWANNRLAIRNFLLCFQAIGHIKVGIFDVKKNTFILINLFFNARNKINYLCAVH